MGDFTATITIARRPEVVFTFLADPTNLPLWLEAVDTVAVDGPPRRGARFRMERSLPGGRRVNDVELTELEPGRRVTLESRAGPTPFRYEFELRPTGDGTRVTLAGRISGAGLPVPVAAVGNLATQLFKRGMQRNLRALERLLSPA